MKVETKGDVARYALIWEKTDREGRRTTRPVLRRPWVRGCVGEVNVDALTGGAVGWVTVV